MIGPSYFELVALLTEALDHVTDKPWDDCTHLHARISAALGLPIQYAEHIAAVAALSMKDTP